MKHVAFQVIDDQEESDDEDVLVRRKQSPCVASTIKMQAKVNSVRPTIRDSPKLSTPTLPATKPREALKVLNPGKRLKRTEPQNTGLKSTELDKFQKLFPQLEEKKKADSPKIKEMAKKSPFKSRVKKLTPRGKSGPKNAKMDLSWFDTDSTFGFGLDD